MHAPGVDPNTDAQERARTSTGFYSHQILNLARLPIPPPGPRIENDTEIRRNVEPRGDNIHKTCQHPPPSASTKSSTPSRANPPVLGAPLCLRAAHRMPPAMFTYCDTEYALRGGRPRTTGRGIASRNRYWRSTATLIELTGGEPLAQAAVFPLDERELCDAGQDRVGGDLQCRRHHPLVTHGSSGSSTSRLRAPASSSATGWRISKTSDRADEIKFVLDRPRRLRLGQSSMIATLHRLSERSLGRRPLISPTFEQAAGTRDRRDARPSPPTNARGVDARGRTRRRACSCRCTSSSGTLQARGV